MTDRKTQQDPLSSDDEFGRQLESILDGGFKCGRSVGEYRLVRLLGRGGMGEVWEAVQESLQRTVALKVMLPGRVDERSIAFFAREARAGGRISHPSIATVYASGESEGVHWIAMEMVEGGATLADFLEDVRDEDKIAEDYYPQVAELTSRIADALEAAHKSGVIHRDLKPRNVLITTEDLPKVVDFGLARVVSEHSLSQVGDFAGTYYYMSPEQVTAKRIGLDHRTDIFSLGIVLYELLTLTRPFEGDTTFQIAEKILMHDPPDVRVLRSRVPDDLSVICGKAMEKRPDARYPSMAELAADLRRYLDKTPIHAKPPGTIAVAKKWVQRNPAKSLGAVITGVAMVVVGIVGSIAIRNADIAEGRLDKIFSILAMQDLERLVRSAEELWPAHPEMIPRFERWLSDAGSMRDGRPGDSERGIIGRPSLAQHRARLAELGAWTVKVEDATKLAVARSHLDYPRLSDLRAERMWRLRMLGREPWPDQVRVEAALRRENLPQEGKELVDLAWDLVGPGSQEFGEEGRGLALARSADARVSADVRPFSMAVLAWAQYCTGSLEEARVTARRASMFLPEGPGLLVRREDGRAPDYANVFWKPGGVLLCLQTGEEITPGPGGLYDIWYARNEQLEPAHGLLSAESLSRLQSYKFKTEEACWIWCRCAFARVAQVKLLPAIQQWDEGSLPDRLSELQDLEAEIREYEIRVGELKFKDQTDEWWWLQLTPLISAIESLFDEKTGLAGDTLAPPFGWGVAKRLEFARGIREDSLPGSEAQALWEEAIDGVASSSLYGGLQLARQLGLLPIGVDKESGLWEFAHLQTGEPAVRGENGTLKLKGETGLVLVLIPGGKFMMGAQASEPQAANFDPEAASGEYPPHEVRLSPYFISKYEMTQGQWQWITGENPSRYPSILTPEEHSPTKEKAYAGHGVVEPLQYPIHLVQWGECNRWLERLGLSLPSEAQWECAARGGTTTAWCTGQDPESVLGRIKPGGSYGTRVGSYPGNGFGLHDVHGNVIEWCLDGKLAVSYGALGDMDPVAPWVGSEFRLVRGGGYKSTAVDARSARRGSAHSDTTQDDLGLRPARRLRY